MDTLRQDLKFALRTFRKNPGFTAIALLTLVLGIGANTAIFSVVNAVLIRSLSFQEPESLAVIWGNVQRAVVERRGSSFPDFDDWRSQNRSFVDLSVYTDNTFTLTGGTDEPERVTSEEVNASYFGLLGVQPLIGRGFLKTEDGAGAPLTAVLGHGLWTRRFGANPAVIGTAVSLSGRPFTIVGVMPRGFRGLTDAADLWVTTAIEPPSRLTNRGSRERPVLGRLKPGVTLAAAQADLTQISKNLERAYPDTNDKRGAEVSPLTTEMFGPIRQALLVVLGAVGVVLLIACANVASLLLGRAEARQREMAVRTALGAGRARLLRQLVVEGLLLTTTAAAIGVAIARFAAQALIAFSPVTFPGFVSVHLDPTVLLFTLGVSTLMGLLLGLAPMWQLGGGSLAGTLKEAGRGATGGGRLWFRQTIVTVEIALALILLVGAGLLIRSLWALNAVDPGYVAEGLLTMRISLPEPPPRPDATAGTAGAAAPVEATAGAPVSQPALAILERLGGVAGVREVSAGSDTPLSGSSAINYAAQNQPPVTAQNRPRAYQHFVAPGFFKTLGIQLVAGREFTAAEIQQAEPTVVIVSEGVVQRFWPNQDPIGKLIKRGAETSTSPWLTIVGVVRDTRYRGLPRNPTQDPDLFFPFRPQARGFALLVRTAVPPETLTETIRREIRGAEPSATVWGVSTLQNDVYDQMARPRFVSWLMGVFSALALLLAAIGVYGVLAQAVGRRTQEIGLRMALGANRVDVLRLVLRRGLGLVAVGLTVGAAGAWLLTGLLQTLLFGVRQDDPVTFAGVIGLLGLVALLATIIPARRAMRVDPLVALRHE